MARAGVLDWGRIGSDGSRYEWEEKRNDDLWVMETIGNKMLHAAGSGAGGAKAQDAAASQPPAPTFVRRGKCLAEGFDPGTRSLCNRFDPVVMLPFSLFDEHEVNRDVHRAAMQLLEDLQGTIPGGFKKSDLELEFSESFCHILEQRCRTVCFRVRPRVRHLFIEGARSRAEHRDRQGVEGEAAAARLDQFEFEANMYLLPEIVSWCAQLRAVKGHTVSELRRTALKKREDQMDAEMRRTGIEGRLRRMSITELPGTALHAEETRLLALSAPSATATEGKALATSRSLTGGFMSASQAATLLTTKGGKGPGPDAPGKPVLCCRCGHSNVWHEEPEASKPQAPIVAPWLMQNKFGRSTISYARPQTPPGQSAMLVGGVLRKAGSMVSLRKY